MEQNLTLSDIVREPALQVRERLDEQWVAELADLYRGQHEVAAIEAVFDGARFLLTDGWHRYEAQLRAWGADAVVAVSVIDASKSVDPMSIAKTRAAMANRDGGLRRTDGDKKRAVLLLRSTPAGRKMTHDEIAKRVGVVRSWVTRILGAAESDVRTNIGTTNDNISGNAPRAGVAALWAQIDAALQTDPGKADEHHAQDLKCHRAVVGRRRSVLGLPKSDPSRHKDNTARLALAEDLRGNPDQGSMLLAKKHGVSPPTVAKTRDSLGLPPMPRGGKRLAPTSAPVNPKRSDDPREQGAEVMPARPAKRSDFVTDTLRAFERATMAERNDAVIAILRRWPELAEERTEQGSMVLQ